MNTNERENCNKLKNSATMRAEKRLWSHLDMRRDRLIADEMCERTDDGVVANEAR